VKAFLLFIEKHPIMGALIVLGLIAWATSLALTI
jgi:hypothetical protein